LTTLHEIHVGPGGTFEPSGKFHTRPDDIDALFDHLRATNVDAITLHFHGGLVPEKDGVEIAKMMRPVYEAANTYPISFVWETGLIRTLRQNVTRVHQTKLFQKLLKWVIKRAAERFGGLDGKGPGAAVAVSTIESELAKDRPFEDYDDGSTGKGASRGGAIAVTEADFGMLRADLEAEFAEIVDEDEEIEALLAEKDGEVKIDTSRRGIFTAGKLIKALAHITFRVIRRHVRDRDHGFYPTVVEEVLREYYLADLGAWVWGSMKDKAGAMWACNEDALDDDRHVGTYFLDVLHAFRAERDLRVNLVGHSAGSIVIANLLAAADRYSGLTFGTIAFLAPAVTSSVAAAQIARAPQKYGSFRQYTMSDEFERNDMLVPGVYTRSLLYFISGVLEPDGVDKPIAGMMRHATQQKPFDRGSAREWADFILGPNRLALADSSVLDPAAEEGFRTTSTTHGGFDNDKKTQESLTVLLQN